MNTESAVQKPKVLDDSLVQLDDISQLTLILVSQKIDVATIGRMTCTGRNSNGHIELSVEDGAGAILSGNVDPSQKNARLDGAEVNFVSLGLQTRYVFGTQAYSSRMAIINNYRHSKYHEAKGRRVA